MLSSRYFAWCGCLDPCTLPFTCHSETMLGSCMDVQLSTNTLLWANLSEDLPVLLLDSCVSWVRYRLPIQRLCFNFGSLPKVSDVQLYITWHVFWSLGLQVLTWVCTASTNLPITNQRAWGDLHSPSWYIMMRPWYTMMWSQDRQRDSAASKL